MPSLVSYTDFVELPAGMSLEFARAYLLPRLVSELTRAGAFHVSVNDEQISFQGGCFAPEWLLNPMAFTSGRISLVNWGGAVRVSYQVSLRDVFVLPFVVTCTLVPLGLLLMALVPSPGWIFLSPGLLLVGVVPVAVTMGIARSLSHEFFRRAVGKCVVPDPEKT